MPARILAPLPTDQVTIPLGGSVPVTVRYDYTALSNLQCFVAAYPGSTTQHFGRDFHDTVVPFGGAAGTHSDQVVKVQTNGVDEPRTHAITVIVEAPPVQEFATQANRSVPAAPAPLPPVGVPIRYIVFGTAEADVAYLAVVLSAWPDGAANKTPLGGVLAMPAADRTWAVELIVPNAANTSYLARVIRFDADDNDLRRKTLVLH